MDGRHDEMVDELLCWIRYHIESRRWSYKSTLFVISSSRSSTSVAPGGEICFRMSTSLDNRWVLADLSVCATLDLNNMTWRTKFEDLVFSARSLLSFPIAQNALAASLRYAMFFCQTHSAGLPSPSAALMNHVPGIKLSFREFQRCTSEAGNSAWRNSASV
jgi:hypothetical protein